MKHTVHVLELRRPIAAPEAPGGEAPDGTRSILAYRSLVREGDLEPPEEAHLADPGEASSIPAGTYLFTQRPWPAERREEAYREAAKALWHEALWRESPLKNDRILVRILSEDGKTVFQVFREIVGAP